MRKGIVRRFALIALLATVTTGLKCAEGPLDIGVGPTTRSVGGTWQGTIVTDLTMRIVLGENNGVVTGTGTMTELGVPFALTVSGTSTDGSFSLDIVEVQHAPFTFTGSVQVSGAVRTMVGVANGSGFANQAITLTRQ